MTVSRARRHAMLGICILAATGLPCFSASARAPVHCALFTAVEAREWAGAQASAAPVRPGYAHPERAAALRSYLGREVPQDYAAAAHGFRLAAEAGDAEARLMLADMYVKGQGVSRSYEAGLRELLAAIPGLSGAARRNAECYAASLNELLQRTQPPVPVATGPIGLAAPS